MVISSTGGLKNFVPSRRCLVFLISEFSLYLYLDHLVAEHVPQKTGDILMSNLPKQFYVALHLTSSLKKHVFYN